MLTVLGWAALAVLAIVALFVLLAALPFRSKETPLEAADTIDRFLAAEVSDGEWDDFTCVRCRDPLVESAKQHVVEIETHHRCSTAPTYLDEAGQLALREVAVSLRRSVA